MNVAWADENLRIIRSLIERSAIYRRAMGPVLLATGALGIAAAGLAWGLGLEEPRSYCGYWMAVAATALAVDLGLIRGQARRRGERMWSPPARRAALALLPAFGAGLLLGFSCALALGDRSPVSTALDGRWVMSAVWLLCYGAGVHAASFFMPRELRFLGWAFFGLGALVLGTAALPAAAAYPDFVHLAMGLGFGGIHVAYGLCLRRAETDRDAA